MYLPKKTVLHKKSLISPTDVRCDKEVELDHNTYMFMTKKSGWRTSHEDEQTNQHF